MCNMTINESIFQLQKFKEQGEFLIKCADGMELPGISQMIEAFDYAIEKLSGIQETECELKKVISCLSIMADKSWIDGTDCNSILAMPMICKIMCRHNWTERDIDDVKI